LNSFRGILVNTLLDTSPKDYENEYFVNLVSTLSVLHIKILKFLTMPKRYLSDENIPLNNLRGGFPQIFKAAFPGVDIEIIQSAFGDLYQRGFVNTNKSIFHTMTSGQGIDLIGNGDRVSELGVRFIRFCTPPND